VRSFVLVGLAFFTTNFVVAEERNSLARSVADVHVAKSKSINQARLSLGEFSHHSRAVMRMAKDICRGCAWEAREVESGLRRAGRRSKTSFSVSPLSLSTAHPEAPPRLAACRLHIHASTEAYSIVMYMNCNHDLSAKHKTGEKGRPRRQSCQSPDPS